LDINSEKTTWDGTSNPDCKSWGPVQLPCPINGLFFPLPAESGDQWTARRCRDESQKVRHFYRKKPTGVEDVFGTPKTNHFFGNGWLNGETPRFLCNDLESFNQTTILMWMFLDTSWVNSELKVGNA